MHRGPAAGLWTRSFSLADRAPAAALSPYEFVAALTPVFVRHSLTLDKPIIITVFSFSSHRCGDLFAQMSRLQDGHQNVIFCAVTTSLALLAEHIHTMRFNIYQIAQKTLKEYMGHFGQV